jgi:ketosteroid isomerase-like protein
MGAEENKKVVLGMLEAMTAGNMSAVSNALADSATWWVAGSFPLSGTMTKAKFCELFGNVGASTENGLRLTPKGITAEGDRVAVEAESYAKLRNGRTYQNQYHLLFVVRDGKVQQVREYMDTMHANQVLCS